VPLLKSYHVAMLNPGWKSPMDEEMIVLCAND